MNPNDQSGVRATLEDAILLAASKHKGQVDKAGTIYILHPLRVMLRLQTEDERIVGVLHDVMEDCSVTLDELRLAGYSETVLEALDYLSKRPEEENNYDAFVRRVATGPELARKVKLADLEDNMDLTRIHCPTEKDYERLAKYHRAVEFLKGTLA